MTNNNNKPNRLKQSTFPIIVSIILVIIGFFYYQNRSCYVECYQHTESQHNEFCNKLLNFNSDTVSKDSAMIVYRDMIVSLLKEHNANTNNILKLQYTKVQDDFSTLTLWASILMIVFLIFSIYSMYKIDDIQNQGFNTLNNVRELSDKAHSHIEKIDNEFKTKIKELNDEHNKITESFNSDYNKKLQNIEETLNTKIVELQNRINTEKTGFQQTIADYRNEAYDILLNIRKIFNEFIILDDEPDDSSINGETSKNNNDNNTSNDN